MQRSKLLKGAALLIFSLPVALFLESPEACKAAPQQQPQAFKGLEQEKRARGTSENCNEAQAGKGLLLGRNSKDSLAKNEEAESPAEKRMKQEDSPVPLASYSRLLERLEELKLRTQIAKEEGALQKALQGVHPDTSASNGEAQTRLDIMEKRIDALEEAKKDSISREGLARPNRSLQFRPGKDSEVSLRGKTRGQREKRMPVPHIVSVQSDETGRFWAAALNEEGKIIRVDSGSRWRGARVRSIDQNGVLLDYPGRRHPFLLHF